EAQPAKQREPQPARPRRTHLPPRRPRLVKHANRCSDTPPDEVGGTIGTHFGDRSWGQVAASSGSFRERRGKVSRRVKAEVTPREPSLEAPHLDTTVRRSTW